MSVTYEYEESKSRRWVYEEDDCLVAIDDNIGVNYTVYVRVDAGPITLEAQHDDVDELEEAQAWGITMLRRLRMVGASSGNENSSPSEEGP